MKYLNTKTGLIEETTNLIAIEQITKHKEIYKPVLGDLEAPRATTQAAKNKATTGRKRAKKEG